MRRLLPLLLVACVGCDASQEVAVEPAIEAPAEPQALPWPGVHRDDDRVDVRVADGDAWLVLRRVRDSDWIRGYARGARAAVAQCGQERRPVAARTWHGSGSRFWIHAAALRALLADPSCSLQVVGLSVWREWISELIGDAGEGVDVELLRYTFGDGGELATRLDGRSEVESPCIATLALVASNRAGWLFAEPPPTPGTARGLFGRSCDPDEPPWAELDGRQVSFSLVEDVHREDGVHDHAHCPGRVTEAQMEQIAAAERVRLCSALCCAEPGASFSAAMGPALERWRAQSALVAERPPPSALAPGPTPPPRPTRPVR